MAIFCILSFILAGLVVGAITDMYWFLLIGGFIGLIIGAILEAMHSSKIKCTDDISGFPPVRDMLNKGWQLYEPTA
jgi:hypothetical protein